MNPETAVHCRDVLTRLRAQVNAHLPPVATIDRHTGQPISDVVVPLDRLPMVGQVVQQLIEAEAVYASANQPSEHDEQADNGEQPKCPSEGDY